MSKVVIISGAARRLGKAFSIGLSRAGYRVVATGTNQSDLDELTERLHGEYLTQVCDITNIDDCKDLVDSVIKKFGRIDVLINNASIYSDSSFENIDALKMKQVFDVVVTGTANISKAVFEPMAKQQSGQIISILGMTSRGVLSAYNPEVPHSVDIAAKRAKAEFTDVLRREAEKSNVTVTAFLMKSVASEIDIDDKTKPPKGVNHPVDAVDCMIRTIDNKDSEATLTTSN